MRIAAPLALAIVWLVGFRHDPSPAYEYKRPAYVRLDAATMPKMTDAEVLSAVDADVANAIDRRWDDALAIVKAMPPGFIAVYAVDGLASSIDEDGFTRAAPSIARYYPDAAAGLRTMGAFQRAAIVDEARALARRLPAQGTPVPNDALAGFWRLNDRWLASTEDVAALKVAWIRAHPDLFDPESGATPVPSGSIL